MNINKNRIKNIINGFSRARVLVVGDLILDQYIFGEIDRISPEAPVPVVHAKERQYLPGGACNVAANITSLGGSAQLVGVIGRDLLAKKLLSEIKERRIGTAGIIQDAARQTILKTRVLGQKQQVVRVDWEDESAISDKTSGRMCEYILKNASRFDAVIIEDYGKGVITEKALRTLKSAVGGGKIITVDPKEEHFDIYRALSVTCITPNRREAECAIRYIKIKDKDNALDIYSDKLRSDNDINLAGEELRKYLRCKSVLITLGESGMRLFETGRVTPIPTFAQEVFDVSGAGDTVIAALTLALASGAGLAEAAFIANHAAGIVVGKLGVATTDRKELRERLQWT
ncbi:MAG: PfkB family carbohydrate kinase [Candidatus Omnitrophica bacterium]|nr:PfkB family carbohydrate kinase [Candidatus Omnitrophota bacterium]